MPKIIEDVQPKILDTALRLFTTEAYDAVDMRRIAEETGIATGTLYNYFSSKQALLAAVFERSWQESLHRLECGLVEGDPAVDRVTLFLRLLHQEYHQNKSLSAIHVQFMQTQRTPPHAAGPLALPPPPMPPFLGQIGLLLFKVVRQQYAGQQALLDEGTLRRLVEVLPVAIRIMDMAHGDTPEENLQFLNDLVHGYISIQLTRQNVTGEQP